MVLSRTFDLQTFVGNLFVWDPPALARAFGIPEGMHILIHGITVQTTVSGTLFLVNDKHGQFRKTITTAQLQDQIVGVIAGNAEKGNKQLHIGDDAITIIAVAGGSGFEDTNPRFLEWDIMNRLIVAKDQDTDAWILDISYSLVPGEMSWDPLSEVDKIRQLGHIQAAPGGIWSQPGTDPGDPYNKADLGGNFG